MGIGRRTSNWYLWWQGKIEGVLYGTEVRVAEHGVRKGAEDVSVGEGMKNGVWKTFCHWHHATGALPGLPLNPKIKEPWIFFSQVKPTRLLIEEGLREVKDLIKILAAAGERFQILSKREIGCSVAVKPRALPRQPAVVWCSIVGHLWVNKGGQTWNLSQIESQTAGRLGNGEKVGKAVNVDIGSPSPAKPRGKKIVASVGDHGGPVSKICFPLVRGEAVQEGRCFFSEKMPPEGIAVVGLDAAPRTSNLFGPSENVTRVE